MDYFTPYDETHIVCNLCRHHCILKEGHTGRCGVNENVAGALKNLVYGHPASIAVDPIEKKPLNHFLPASKVLSFGTVGCNFRCPFCQNWQLSQEHHIDTTHFVSPEQMVDLALAHGCASIAFTYNEPTIFYPYAKDIALLAHAAGLKTVYVSNGFESTAMIEDMAGVIDAVNIDLKSFKSDYYHKVLKGGLDEVLQNLKHFKRVGIWVEITTLIVPHDNDSDEELAQMAQFISQELDAGTPWHISAFHPDYKMHDRPPTAKATLDRAYALGKKAGLRYVYEGNVRGQSNTQCPKCDYLLIRRSGFSVLENHLKNGTCPRCHTPIEGVWQ